MVRNSSNLAQSNCNTFEEGKSWKRLQFLHIPASSKLDHLKAVLEVLFLLFYVIARGRYIIAVVKEVTNSAVCGRESGAWYLVLNSAEWAKSN